MNDSEYSLRRKKQLTAEQLGVENWKGAKLYLFYSLLWATGISGCLGKRQQIAVFKYIAENV